MTIIVPPSNPHFVPPKQHSTYNWHIALLWVSVIHTLTLFSIAVNKVVPRSSVSLLLGFSAMLSISLVSRVTVRSLLGNMLDCQSPSGEWS